MSWYDNSTVKCEIAPNSGVLKFAGANGDDPFWRGNLGPAIVTLQFWDFTLQNGPAEAHLDGAVYRCKRVK